MFAHCDGRVALLDERTVEAISQYVYRESNPSIAKLTQVLMQAKRLLPNEASHKSLCVWAERCGYASTLVSGYKDRWDNLTEGTPLHWAICRKRLDLVKILLSHGADPQYNGSTDSNLTSFELAAFLHEHKILSTMIDFKYPGPRFPYHDLGARNSIHQESTHSANGSVPHGLSIWIKEAIRGCDNWTMLFRHGDQWKHKMEETFKIIGHELRFAFLNEGVDGEGFKESPLNFAAKHGFHEAVEMIMLYANGKAGSLSLRNRGFMSFRVQHLALQFLMPKEVF